MNGQKRDFAPWLLLPAIVLTLSGVTLLAPHQAALAAPPASQTAAPKVAAVDDGDGDELLEHWGDPKYAREEQYQAGGILGGFLLLGMAGAARRAHRKSRCEIVPLPTEGKFLKRGSQTNHRKAA